MLPHSTQHLCIEDAGIWCVYNCFRKWSASVAMPFSKSVKSLRKAVRETPLENVPAPF